MKTISKALTKGTIGAVAAGALAMTSAAPAQARDRDEDGISAGEIIAGAVILGGIAAIAGSIGKDNSRYDRTYGGPYYGNDYRRNDYRYGYNRYDDPRQAVEQCVRTAELTARRYGYRNADVTQVRDVDRRRDGFRIRGTVAVNGGYGYRDRYAYDSRYRDQRRYDDGRFTCEVRRGRVVDIDYSGIRGLR